MLDFVRDMGNDLHRGAEIVAAPLLGDDMVVNGAGGGVVLPRHGHIEIALVVAEIQIRLRAVVGDEDLAMLEGIHGAGVHIDVRVQLLDGDIKPARLQQRPKRGRRQSLAQRGKHPARHEDELGFHGIHLCSAARGG